ncbi:helix-turn-helix domain-containing protein [Salinilacihabitans rarus]|uniref:helix-turn-helix domain-containing protein n=1 Tax=Salinilacihabitans rarus TaxID=2961596 RepID=UPI0020C8E76A|nr:helix-turn-helix domain-containing protein [Salinilacihabitans rarus]
MTMPQQLATPRIDPLPDDVESAHAKLVLLYLEATGGATADELNDVLGLKKLSVLSVVRSLSTAGLVERDGDEYLPRR